MSRTCLAVMMLPWVIPACGAGAQEAGGGRDLPAWKVKPSQLELLDARFAKHNISIQPPKRFEFSEDARNEQRAKHGLAGFTWANTETELSPLLMTVGLAPFKQPSAANLDKTVEGVKNGLSRACQDFKLAGVKAGRLNGDEVRLLRYSGVQFETPVKGYSLVGIDNEGTYTVSVQIFNPDDADPELVDAMKASMLTIARP